MKRILLSFAVFLTAMLGCSYAAAQTLVLHHADGTTTDVQLYMQPQVKFQNDRVLITSTVLNMDYAKTDILRFTYKGDGSGIGTPNAKAAYTYRDGQLVFHGVKSSDAVAIYKSNGIRVPVNLNRQGSDVVLSLSQIPTGVYLLKVNGRTSKFTKR
ncbi:MAG: T9SS type A sorting domain-containing protein [Prevotella sp.]|nr:T9SS type A sorting domain-containing protein [Prevotella sp.]